MFAYYAIIFGIGLISLFLLVSASNRFIYRSRAITFLCLLGTLMIIALMVLFLILIPMGIATETGDIIATYNGQRLEYIQQLLDDQLMREERDTVIAQVESFNESLALWQGASKNPVYGWMVFPGIDELEPINISKYISGSGAGSALE